MPTPRAGLAAAFFVATVVATTAFSRPPRYSYAYSSGVYHGSSDPNPNLGASFVGSRSTLSFGFDTESIDNATFNVSRVGGVITGAGTAASNISVAFTAGPVSLSRLGDYDFSFTSSSAAGPHVFSLTTNGVSVTASDGSTFFRRLFAQSSSSPSVTITDTYGTTPVQHEWGGNSGGGKLKKHNFFTGLLGGGPAPPETKVLIEVEPDAPGKVGVEATAERLRNGYAAQARATDAVGDLVEQGAQISDEVDDASVPAKLVTGFLGSMRGVFGFFGDFQRGLGRKWEQVFPPEDDPNPESQSERLLASATDGLPVGGLPNLYQLIYETSTDDGAMLSFVDEQGVEPRGFNQYGFTAADDALLAADMALAYEFAADRTRQRIFDAAVSGDNEEFRIQADHFAFLLANSEEYFDEASDWIELEAGLVPFALSEEYGGPMPAEDVEEILAIYAEASQLMRQYKMRTVLELSSIEPTRPGDYNADGVVDLNDYQEWQASYGATGFGWPADGNSDGVVDAADYTVWRDAFDLAGLSITVPEPHSVTLTLFLASLWRLHRRAVAVG